MKFEFVNSYISNLLRSSFIASENEKPLLKTLNEAAHALNFKAYFSGKFFSQVTRRMQKITSDQHF